MIKKHSTIWQNRRNDWAALRVHICLVHLTVCYYHVTCAFQSEFKLCSCLNVKELPGQNKRDIWILSDSNRTGTHKHLVCKRTLKNLVKLSKWLTCVVSSYLYGAIDCMLLPCQLRISKWVHNLQLPEY